MSVAAEFLGTSGPLSRTLPAYEARPGQIEMATAVQRALEQERVLLCEAGTGTGKTFAYLLAAIFSGKKVIVSTATRTLQEQIAYKDLPILERAVGRPVKASVLKGLSNYLCLRRMRAFELSEEANRPRFTAALSTLHDWIGQTATGDIAELAGLSENDPVFSHVVSSTETRIGQRCPHFEDCFVTRARSEAETARIVVVNHHLFFADLALRGPHPGHILPDYDAVIFDEAHQLQDIATNFFGVRVSKTRIERLLQDAERSLKLLGVGDRLFSAGSSHNLLDQVAAASDAFFGRLSALVSRGETRISLEREAFGGEVEEQYHLLDDALEGLAALSESASSHAPARGTQQLPNLSEALELATRRALQLRQDLASIVETERGNIRWLDVTNAPALSSTPVDVSSLLRELVFDTVPAVVLTSATLTTFSGGTQKNGTGPFSYLRSSVGLGDFPADELVVRSPFDFEQRALLYTPNDLPLPNEQSFLSQISERSAQLIEMVGGGCFLLTTSLRSMKRLHDALKQRLPTHRVLVQGQAPKAALLSAFKAAKTAVLVATLSFWEGVDVPGSALRLVILEKMPFAVPSDPIFRARALALEQEGKNPFMELFVPAAAITLKQGFGRLIRSRTDAGIVALLDRRVLKQAYGRLLLQALPPAPRTDNLTDVGAFVERLRSEGCFQDETKAT